MKCGKCNKEYKKTLTPRGRWLYERQCKCKRGSENEAKKPWIKTGRTGSASTHE